MSTFAFVARDYGFSPARLEVDERIHFDRVIFTGTHLAIECILDEREDDVSCKISRVLDGKRSTDYAVDAAGVRVREALASLVRRHGVNKPLFRNVRTLPPAERLRVTLEDFAMMLQTYATDVLADSPSALD